METGTGLTVDNKDRENHLRELIQNKGFYVWMETMVTPQKFRGGILEEVKIDSAWVGFRLDGTAVRTKTFQDRNNFLSWLDSKKEVPISEHNDHKDKFGPPNVTFIKLCGMRTV